MVKHWLALWQCLSISRWIGIVLACRSRRSVGVVLRRPVIAIVPALWVVVSFDTAVFVLLLCGFVSSSAFGIPQTSTAYRILGIATLLYIFRACFSVRPHKGAATRLICELQLATFLIAYAI